MRRKSATEDGLHLQKRQTTILQVKKAGAPGSQVAMVASGR